ncbi:MAG: TetR/AcrR family transcriptional regulator [Peptostreptococcaceae bacterium]
MKQNNTKLKILLTSIKLMTRKGINETSLADIANSCNISKGTLYYYYQTKDDLICDVADIHLDIITKTVLDCICEVDPKLQNEYMINTIIKKISGIGQSGKIHIYILSEAINSNDTLNKKLKEKYVNWRETLRFELRKYSKDENDADALSFLLISIVDGLLVQSILFDKKSIDYSNIANFLVNNLI